MFRSAAHAARFLWHATSGYRLRPWRSPYLRWRVETYTGWPAATLRPADFFRLAWNERRQLGRFFLWLGALGELARGDKP